MKLLCNLPILAFSTILIQGALLPHKDTEVSAGGLRKRVGYVHVTEYSTVYVQPNPTIAPPGGWNFTQTSEVVVTTTLNATTSSSTDTYHRTLPVPAQSQGSLNSSSIHGTGVFNWPARSSQQQSRPAPSASATLALPYLPKSSYAPSRTSCSKSRIVETGKPSLGRTFVPSSPGAGSAIFTSTSKVATVSAETTAIVVVPVHPSSLGVGVVPTHPSTPAVMIVPIHPSTPAVVNVPVHPSTPAVVIVPTHPPVAAKAMNYPGHLSQSVGIKSEQDIRQDIPHVLPRAGPTLIDTTIEHGTWSYHEHGTNNVEMEHGDLVAILPNHLDVLPGKHNSDSADSAVVSPARVSNHPDANADADADKEEKEEDAITLTSKKTMFITKTRQRLSSTPSTSTQSLIGSFNPPNPTTAQPKSPSSPPPSSSSTNPPTETPTPTIITTLLTPDPHCPYPYPNIYCGPAKTTLITETMTNPPTQSPPPPTDRDKTNKDKTKEHTTRTTWCPYPGQKC